MATIHKPNRFEPVEVLRPAPFKPGSAIALKYCIPSIVVGIAASLTAGEVTPEVIATPKSPSVLTLPEFLKRGHQDQSDPKRSQSGRFVARAIELLRQARAHEASGKHQAALETAQRAAIAKAAQDTTEVGWPNGQQSPEEYIAGLKRRTGVTDKRAAASVDRAEFAPTTFQLFEKLPSTVAVPSEHAENFSRKPATPLGNNVSVTDGSQLSAAVVAVNPNVPGHQPTTPPPPSTRPIQADSDAVLVQLASGLPTSDITSTDTTESEGPSSPFVDSTDELDETDQLLQQLDELETWSAIEPPAGESSDIRNPTTVSQSDSNQAAAPSPPLIIPGLIDRPDGIDDRKVGPIPTRSTDTVEGSASEAITTTIPVVPETIDAPPKQVTSNAAIDQKPDTAKRTSDFLVNVYETTPRLLTQSADTPTAAMTETGSNSASIWQLAAAQLVATFLGVILAGGLVLLIRVAAIKLFGTHLGIVFQFGSMRGSSVQAAPVDEPSDIVSFGTQSSKTKVTSSAIQSDEPNPADFDTAPAGFPFRVVGTTNGEVDTAAQGNVSHQNNAEIFKSVFDNNLDLMSDLDKHNGSAA